jgi:hypothetical protein
MQAPIRGWKAHWSWLARPGKPDVAYLEVQGRGHLVESSDEVSHYGLLYDLLRAVDLPPDTSREMIAGFAKGDHQ